MKAVMQLRDWEPTKLQQELKELQREYFNLRVQKATGALSRFHRLKQVRRQIARVNTLLREKALVEEQGNE